MHLLVWIIDILLYVNDIDISCTSKITCSIYVSSDAGSTRYSMVRKFGFRWLFCVDFYYWFLELELLSGDRYTAGVIYKWWKNQYLPFLVWCEETEKEEKGKDDLTITSQPLLN